MYLKCLFIFAALSVSISHAEDFSLYFMGDGPITIHTILTYEGKGEHLIATAKNESPVAIKKATICIQASGICLFKLWNTAEWAAGGELQWDMISTRRTSDLTHSAEIDGFERAEQDKVKTISTHQWQRGLVLDSQTAKNWQPTGVTTELSANTGLVAAIFGDVNSATQIHGMTLKQTDLLIITQDFIFVVTDVAEQGRGLYGSLGRAIYNRKHGCHVIINDPINFYQERSDVFVTDVDGKECKMDLIRQERIVSRPPPPQQSIVSPTGKPL